MKLTDEERALIEKGEAGEVVLVDCLHIAACCAHKLEVNRAAFIERAAKEYDDAVEQE